VFSFVRLDFCLSHKIKKQRPPPHPKQETMNQQLQEAIRINSMGVSALLSGDENLAVTSCAESIKIMKGLLSTLTIGADHERAPRSFLHQSTVGDCSWSVELPNVEVHGHVMQDSILFNQAINIPDFGPHCPLPSESDIHVCTAVFIFNLAIAHHRQGKKTGLAALTVKAEKLYSMILKLLGDDSTNNTVIGVLVKLASVNNLLEIRLESGDYVLAREGLGQVSKMLRCCTATSQGISNVPTLQDSNVKCLLMNILLLRPPNAAPAA
jgi:hypothetical protein